MASTAVLRFETVRPEPARMWIRHVPKSWPGPEGLWVDLGRSVLAGRELMAAELPIPDRFSFQDVVYLPPVASGAELLRQRVVERCSELGIPSVLQVLAGTTPPAGAGSVVVDLTAFLLRSRLAEAAIPGGSWVVWPLIPGLTDDEESSGRGLDLLAARGVTGVLPLVPFLSPRERRRLAEFAPAASFPDLFRRQDSLLLERFSRRAARRRLAAYPRRPPLPSFRRTPNRELAEHFAVLADLWLRCGRPEGRAQVFFGTARRLDEEPLDVAELARRGGLSTIDWLDEESLDETRRFAAGGQSPLRQQLEKEQREGEG